jgi:hypothetical protein
MERSKQSTIAIIICIAILSLCAATSARIIYVDDDANGLGDGSSWKNAFVYLQDALALARTIHKSVEIRVAQGTYRPDQGANQTGLKHDAPPHASEATFELVEGLVLKGGYAGVLEPDPNARDVHKYQTTLSGDLLGNDVPTGSPERLLNEPTRWDNCRHVVTGAQLTAATVLDGFSITGGSHTAIPRGGQDWGGPGIYLIGASPTLANCWLHGNCIRVGDGGALFNYAGSKPTVVNCIFSDNFAARGGAISNNWYDSNAKVINCTFHNNWAVRGGAVFNGCIVSNCILWGNQPDEIGWDNLPPDITYSDIAGGWRGEGNVDVDPCFAKVGYWADPNSVNVRVDPNHPNAVWIEGDSHLKSQAGRWDPNEQRWVMDDVSSPCIDVGDPNSPVGDEPEPNGGRINMGAYGGTAEASKSYSDRL